MPPPIPLLTAGRAAIGAGAWLAPHLTGRVLGLDSGSAAQQRLLVRLFAVRDLALAVGLQLSRDQSRRLLLQLGIACDAADGVAGLLGGREERRLMLLSGPALIGVGLGLVALQAESSPS
jgi:hypothetical protein